MEKARSGIKGTEGGKKERAVTGTKHSQEVKTDNNGECPVGFEEWLSWAF